MALSSIPSVKVVLLGVGRTSVDLTLAVGVLAATVLAVVYEGVLAAVFEGFVWIARVPLALLLVFFVPGYLLTIALFPAGGSTLRAQGDDSARTVGITVLERLVLSVGLSVSTVVLVLLLIDALPTAIAEESILGGLVVVSAVAVLLGAARRRATPPSDRYVPLETSMEEPDRPSRIRSMLWVVLVASILFAGVGLVHAGGAVADQRGVTELYFVGDDEGETGPYPVNLTADEQRSVTVAVDNVEGETVEYTVVGQLQRIDRGDRQATVGDREQIVRERRSVSAGERWMVNATVTPQQPGAYRLVSLLYEGAPPDDPRLANADQEIHLWIDVAESATDGGQAGT